MSSSILEVFIIISISINILLSEKCDHNDMIYQYTECNKVGQRWLVLVPNTTKSCDKDSYFVMPRKARDCGNPCEPGTFLNLETQECKECEAGTYSQSDTIEIDHWQKMPSGFNNFSIGYVDENCQSENWMAKGDYMAARVSQCESHVYYTASLYKDGELYFQYQNPEDVIFAVKVSNDNCQSSSNTKENSDKIKYLDTTGPSNWKKITIPLKKGSNLIRWVVVGVESHTSTVKIKYLKITNSLFSSDCIKCHPGYFSSSRSSKCTPCMMNTYSNQPGSSSCTNCVLDQYSFPGSKSCTDRPPCNRLDYTYKWTLCDKDNQRKKLYYWIDPKLCSETKPGSIKLPTDSKMETCLPCPAGTYLNVKTNKCEFCAVGTASAVSGIECTKCPPNTKPITEIIYDQWSRPLPSLSFRCFKIEKNCSSNETWIYNGNNLQSSPATDINLLQFDFEIISEQNASFTKSSSQLSTELSMKCSGYCVLHLFLKKSKSSTIRIKSWVNSTDRQIYNYNIYREEAGKFIWFFSHSKDYKTSEKTNDYVQIYSIKMTKLKNVGAVKCQYCNPDSPSTECSDCEKGKYFSIIKKTCVQCPTGYILKQSSGRRNGNCVKCGEGLLAVNGSACLPDIHYRTPSGNHYHLTPLKGTHEVTGKSLFTTHGQQYKHLFNITLFGIDGTLSICKNNVTMNDEYFYDEFGPMCRLTLITSKAENDTIYAMQSIRLADQFTEVRQSNSSVEFWKKMNESLKSKGFPEDVNGMDLHYTMESESVTVNCKKGYGTILTLRCDRTTTNNKLLIAPNCPMETCDGCNFHFLLLSKDACPECRLEDYYVITEECFNGHQTRHYQLPSYCVHPKGFLDKIEVKCPLFTTKMELGILITASLLLFLLGLVIYCYKKNKKLEYKYMRLVGGNDDNENVLNGAESCGMQDDEEEEDDDVKIKTNSKSGKIFAKYNKPSQYRNDKNSMERINLNENPDFDI